MDVALGLEILSVPPAYHSSQTRPFEWGMKDHKVINSTGGLAQWVTVVLGRISFDVRTELIVVQEMLLASQNNLYDIIEEHAVAFAPFIGDGYVFINDNASRPLRSRMVDEQLPERLVWPPQSPEYPSSFYSPMLPRHDNLCPSVIPYY